MMLKAIIFGLVFLFFIWLIVSSAVFIWWFWHPYQRDRIIRGSYFKSGELKNPSELKKWAEAFFVGVFLNLLIVLALGIHKVLSFLPGSGRNEDGDYGMFGCLVLAFPIGYFFSLVFENFEKMRKENRQWRKQAGCLSVSEETQERINEIWKSGHANLVQERNRIKTELERVTMGGNAYLITGEEREVLERLSDWIEKQL